METVGTITLKGCSRRKKGEHGPNAALGAKGTHRLCWRKCGGQRTNHREGHGTADRRNFGESVSVPWLLAKYMPIKEVILLGYFYSI